MSKTRFVDHMVLHGDKKIGEIILCFRDKNIMFFILDSSVTLELLKQILLFSLLANEELVKAQLLKPFGRNYLYQSIAISNNEKQGRNMLLVLHDTV